MAKAAVKQPFLDPQPSPPPPPPDREPTPAEKLEQWLVGQLHFVVTEARFAQAIQVGGRGGITYIAPRMREHAGTRMLATHGNVWVFKAGAKPVMVPMANVLWAEIAG